MHHDSRRRFDGARAGELDLRGGRSQHRSFTHALSFIRRATIRSGEVVLVTGATGAIGAAAVQLLKSIGADLTAICNTDNVALVRGLGADRVIDYTIENSTRDERTYEVVIDAVGESSFGRCRRLLTAGGIHFSSDVGYPSQNPILALISPLPGGTEVMLPVPQHDQEMMR